MNEKIVTQIDWKLIGYHKTNNEIFKNSLYISVYCSTTYSDFNKYILQAIANTKITINQKKKVWFHFNNNYLLPFIETIN